MQSSMNRLKGIPRRNAVIAYARYDHTFLPKQSSRLPNSMSRGSKRLIVEDGVVRGQNLFGAA